MPNERLLTKESMKEKVERDLTELHGLYLKTFHESSSIWTEARHFQETVLEEFREAQAELIVKWNEIDRLMKISDDPNFVVDALGLEGPYDPSTDPSHVEGYEWVNPTIVEDPDTGERRLRGTRRPGVPSPEDEPSNVSGLVAPLRDDSPTTLPIRGGLREIKAILAENQNASNERKLSAISRFAFVSAGLVLPPAEGATAHLIMRRAVENKGDSDLPGSQKLKDILHALVKTWQTQPDSVYWGGVAQMIDLGLIVNGEKTPLTIADQVCFMNFAVEMSPLQEIWSWKTLPDVWQNANAIKSFYDKSRVISDVYRYVLEVTYEGRVLPRGVAAKQLQLVLGLVAKESRENPQSGDLNEDLA